MSVWQHSLTPAHSLAGSNGALISVSIAVDPRVLEALLECLATVSFPINPEIYHGVPTRVVFPVWARDLHRLRDALRASSFDPGALTTRDMLDEITS